MSQRLQDLEIPITDKRFEDELAERLQWLSPGYSTFRLRKKSVDARRRTPAWVVSVDVYGEGEVPSDPPLSPPLASWPASQARPIVVGSGPAGLFAAIRFVERGIPCLLLERGSTAEKRIFGINRYWRYGELNPDDNVCIGEGGAGLYSDGKLITRIKSPHIPYVMDRFVRFGAPEEIRYLANPHVGSDRIRRVIPQIRAFLQKNGCEIRYNSRVRRLEVDQTSSHITGVWVEDMSGSGEQVLIHSDHVVLATGHSAEDILLHLIDVGVKVEGKSFALGLRIEHPQEQINRIQHRGAAGHPDLGAANYRLADHDPATGVGVYSFCMCPGGYVLSSGTEKDGVVCNGMSNYARSSKFANSAVVVSIDHTARFGKDLLGGLKFRRSLETAAYESVIQAGGTKQIPAQDLLAFLEGRSGPVHPTSSPSGVVAARLDTLLPNDLTERLRSAVRRFDRQMRGFISPTAQFHGVESRTSCPLRVTRDDQTLESVSHRGLYPCGEGAGYAGGITSAACDGIRVADAIIDSVSSRATRLTSSAELAGR